MERVNSQKDRLIRQLDEVEDKASVNTGVYRKILLLFTDILRPAETDPLCDNINQFKQLVKKGSGTDTLENAFEQLKNAVIRQGGDFRTDESPKAPGTFLTSWIKKKSGVSTQEKYILKFREAYQDIVDVLGLDMGPEFLQKLLKIRRNIGIADSLDDFDSLRQEIIALLHDYMSSSSFEREKAGDFIKDIWVRLIDVQKNLSQAFEASEGLISSGGEIQNTFSSGLDTLKETVDINSNIDELKSVFYAKLDVIRTTIKEKHEKDSASRKGLYKSIARLKSDFDRMKKEASSARDNVEELERELHIDQLTGSLNRRAYDKRVEEEITRYKRYGRAFSLLIFDVDLFKRVNDTYGHATGDKCLKEIIVRIKPLLRDCDLLARFGGEEFVVLLPETSRDGALDVAEKLRQAVEKIEFLHKDDLVQITISVGVTEIIPEDEIAESLFVRMDMAMYEAKNSGRHRVAFR